MRKYLSILSMLFTVLIYSQSDVRIDESSKKMQYGFSTKLVFDLGFRNHSNVRIGFSTGIGFQTYSSNITSLNFEYSILKGGLGAFNNKWSSYFVIAPHFCQAVDLTNSSNPNGFLQNNQPLYYFTDLVTPALLNPYKKSFSIGANFIHFVNRRIPYKWQRVAHLGIKFNNVQLVYNNDGGALMKIWGDKEDRYFTGTGFLRIQLDKNEGINNIGLSFYKFTGYKPMSFEVSDELLFSSVDYIDPKQNLFNKGFWSLQVGNSKYGEIFLRYNNPRNIKEVQNFIHYNMGFGYHQNPEDNFFTIGGSINNGQTNIPGK